MVVTYFRVTTIRSAQKIIDSEPITATWLEKPLVVSNTVWRRA